MRLVKGDESNLQGTVVVYSKFKPSECGESCPDCSMDDIGEICFALYATNDEETFKKEMKNVKGLEEKLLKAMNSIPDDMKGPLRHMFVKPTTIEESDIPFMKHDVFYVGEVTDAAACAHLVMLGLEMYAVNLHDQLSRNTGRLCDEEPEEVLNYKEIDKKEALGYITKNFVDPMIKAAEAGRDFFDIQERFMLFSSPSPFTNDCLELCKVIEKCGAKQDLELVTAYASKIAAIIGQDYETAKLKREEIARYRALGRPKVD